MKFNKKKKKKDLLPPQGGGERGEWGKINKKILEKIKKFY